MYNFPVYTSILFILLSTVSSLVAQTPEVEQTLSQFKNYHKILPDEKVYLQLDRPFYSPGETIYYTTFITGANNQLSSALSSFVYVELQSPGDKKVYGEVINVFRGRIAGHISLPKTISGGIYKIRAFTDWQKNISSDTLFERKIYVQQVLLPQLLLSLDLNRESYLPGDTVQATLNARKLDGEPISNHDYHYTIFSNGKSQTTATTKTNQKGTSIIKYVIPSDIQHKDMLLNIKMDVDGQNERISEMIKIDFGDEITLDFYPEGGDLLAGTLNRIAFMANTSFGKPQEVRGFIRTTEGEHIVDFESYHQGLGSFSFTPKANQKYVAEITGGKTYNLPKVLSSGIAIQVKNVDTSKITFNLFSPNNQKGFILLHANDSIYAIKEQQLNSNQITPIEVFTERLPMGVSTITVLDEYGQPQAERLVFVNQHRRIQVKLEPNKSRYAPRTKVDLNIEVKDSEGHGLPGNYCLRVFDEKLNGLNTDDQDNILSHFLLSSVLRGKIHEPEFYLNNKEEKAHKALDLLLLTHGWRRFTWKDLLSTDQISWKQQIQFPVLEKQIRFRVWLDDHPARNAKVKISALDEAHRTDENGHFQIKQQHVKLPLQVEVAYKGFKESITFAQFNAYNDRRLRQRHSQFRQRFQKPIPANHFGIDRHLDQYSSTEISINKTNPLEDITVRAGRVTGSNADKSISVLGSRSMATSLSSTVIVAYSSTPSPFLSGPDFYIPEKSKLRLKIYPEYNYGYRYRITNNNGKLDHRSFFRQYFRAPTYSNKRSKKSNRGNDRRKTLFYDPFVKVDENGLGSTSFYTSDDKTSFHVNLEGIGDFGGIAMGDTSISVEAPLSISAKVPKQAVKGDLIQIPVILKNTTNETISGVWDLELPPTLAWSENKPDSSFSLKGKSYNKVIVPVEVMSDYGAYNLVFSIRANGFEDILKTSLRCLPNGYPQKVCISGKAKESTYQFEIEELMDNSLTVELALTTEWIKEVLDGIEGIIREPHGCFEQTTSANYPNLIAYQLIKGDNYKNVELKNRLFRIMQKGYKKILTFQNSSGGFGLYPNRPPQLKYTAIGLLQLQELQSLGVKVNQNKIDKAAKWILKNRDSSGLFFKNNYRNVNNYQAADNAFVTHLLSKVGGIDLTNALKYAYEEAYKSKDIYRLALTSLAFFNEQRIEEGNQLVSLLQKEVNTKPLKKINAESTFTRSTGHSNHVETVAIALQAILKSTNPDEDLVIKLIEDLLKHKTGLGYFGSTQATVQALKAIEAYALHSKRIEEKGDMVIQINEYPEMRFELDSTARIPDSIIINIRKQLQVGTNQIITRFLDFEDPPAFALEANWQASKPQIKSNPSDFNLKISWTNQEVKVGELARLQLVLNSSNGRALSSPIAIIGLPAGCRIELSQLEKLQEQGLFDYFELNTNKLILYYESWPENTQKIIPLNLFPQVPGKYQSPVSQVFEYYSSEYKNWINGSFIKVLP